MRLQTVLRTAVAAVLVTLLCVQPAFAWGNDGHMLIARLAVINLPQDVPAFLRNGHAADVIEWLGPEPDRWRNRAESELSATQAPDHFIDLEWADLAATNGVFPKQRYEWVRALAAAQVKHPEMTLTPEKVGMQPWQVEEIWQKLKVDLREYRKLVAANKDTSGAETAVLYDAGWLSHYVADGSMPLHTSIQYNGWQTATPNPNGYTTEHKIHALFESINVSHNIKMSDVAPLVAQAKARAIDDEWAEYIAYLRHSNTLVERTYQLEKAGGFTGDGTPEGKAFTAERLAAGAIELRDLINAAWVHSADPVEEFRG